MMVSLAEVVEFNPKPTRERLQNDTEVSFVPMSAVEAGTGCMDTSTVRSYAAVKKGYTFFADGDVLFAKITPCMENGKSAVAAKLRNGIGFGSTEFHVLRPGNRIEARFLYHFIAAKRFRNEAAHHMTEMRSSDFRSVNGSMKWTRAQACLFSSRSGLAMRWRVLQGRLVSLASICVS